MKRLYILTAILVGIGIVFDFAYFHRKKNKFDSRCNDYFIISRAFEITGITLLFVTAVISVFNL